MKIYLGFTHGGWRLWEFLVFTQDRALCSFHNDAGDMRNAFTIWMGIASAGGWTLGEFSDYSQRCLASFHYDREGMRTYFGGEPYAHKEEILDGENRLISYAFKDTDQRGAFNKRLSGEPPKRPQLFLDSGAFSAYTKGVSIDIDKYIAFVKEFEPFFEVYASLDAIGDPVESLRNQKYLEAAGLKPLPCFHFGEPMKYLKWYLDRYDYIALGGVAAGSTQAIQPWLDECWGKYICDDTGMPRVKIHGFGMTDFRLMLRFPWYSVDSTTWIMTSRMGGIFVPPVRGQGLDYGNIPWKVSMSHASPNKKEAGKHYSTLTPLQREVILGYVRSKGFGIGHSSFFNAPEGYELKKNERWVVRGKKDRVEVIEEEGLSNSYKLRDKMNIMYFLDLEKAIPPWPWPFLRRQFNAGLGL